MKFGVCASIDKADIVKKAGFDFIECTVVSLQPEEKDRDVAYMMKQYLDSPLPVEAFNIFLPGDLKVVGESVDQERIKRYVETALHRVKSIGGESIVFGSGKARYVPEGFSHERAEDQILQFLDIVADHADDLGITIVIEPLNTDECNIINSVPEAAKYVNNVNRKSIKALADFYHMYKEEEPLENIVEYKDVVHHIHVSDSRKAPGFGNYPYDQFVDCVRRADYDGRISIECLWDDFEAEVTSGRTFLAEVFSK